MAKQKTGDGIHYIHQRFHETVEHNRLCPKRRLIFEELLLVKVNPRSQT